MASATDKAVRLPIAVKVTESGGAYNTATLIGHPCRHCGRCIIARATAREPDMTTTTTGWTDATVPQHKGWYALAFKAGDWVFPAVNYWRGDGLWDHGRKALVAIAGPFKTSGEARGWVDGHMAEFADEVREEDQSIDWVSILTMRLKAEAFRRVGPDLDPDPMVDLLLQAASELTALSLQRDNALVELQALRRQLDQVRHGVR